MYRRKRENTAKKVAIGGAIAGVLGYLAGILTAPKSGKATRKDIKKNANKARAEAEKDLKKLHTELDKNIAEAKVRSGQLGARAQKELNEALAKAKDSKEKAREVLSAVHEGDADDQDLAKAVKSAQRSIKHLKNYLKK
ncbi:MAG TPA: YtxH domain-containing protein [Candidatus Saccharimonadales bacterium]|nr:YtxH domain-containing protein [Candidatus Saccharimonadales bacterium]